MTSLQRKHRTRTGAVAAPVLVLCPRSYHGPSHPMRLASSSTPRQNRSPCSNVVCSGSPSPVLRSGAVLRLEGPIDSPQQPGGTLASAPPGSPGNCRPDGHTIPRSDSCPGLSPPAASPAHRSPDREQGRRPHPARSVVRRRRSRRQFVSAHRQSRFYQLLRCLPPAPKGPEVGCCSRRQDRFACRPLSPGRARMVRVQFLLFGNFGSNSNGSGSQNDPHPW